MNAVVRISAVVAVVVLTIGACMFAASDFKHRSLPRGFESPVLAMEMARSMEEIKAIVGGPGHSDRSQMRSQQHMDFLFIVAYWSEFLLIGVLLWHRNFSLARLLALIAWSCATLAAGLDVRENVGILGVLSAPPTPEHDPLVQAVRFAATSKWLLLFVAMILLSFVFIRRRDKRGGNGITDRIIFFLPGLFCLATGVVGLAGLWWNVLLNCVALLMLFGLFTLVVALFWSPPRLLRGL
jgi:hypothetical protein